MGSIYQLVNETLKIGYLSLETENQIQQLFAICLNRDDIEALITLQQAISLGYVKREAHQVAPRCTVKHLAAIGSR